MGQRNGLVSSPEVFGDLVGIVKESPLVEGPVDGSGDVGFLGTDDLFHNPLEEEEQLGSFW